jgi:hypothetical protein
MNYLNWHMKRERMDRSFSDLFESSGGMMVGTEDIKGPYINPDSLSRDKRPFIYLGKDVVSGGKLHISSNPNMTHRDLVGRNKELKSRMHDLGYDNSYDYRVDGIKHDLMGRIGDWTLTRSWLDAIDWDGLPPDIFLVSFWNREKPLYDLNLVDCLRSMERFFVGKDVFVSTPLLGTVHISKVMGGSAVGVAMSDSDREKLELHQKLHLMGPNEKKAAMEKLGLGGVKVSKRGEWEAGMRGLGMPGYIRQSEWSDL